MNQIKLKRIASQIIREVSDILNNDARDNLMHTITITGCDVSNDLSYAKIYFTCALDIDKKSIEKYFYMLNFTYNLSKKLIKTIEECQI